MRIPSVLVSGLLVVLLSAPAALGAQARSDRASEEAYFRAVGEYFRVPVDEVAVLAEWELPPEEIPVVLFLSRRGGVSADALVTLRRGGRSWQQLGQRYGLQAGAFHVALPESSDGGPLAGAYAKFRGVPSGGWNGLALEDGEIVGLVNVRFLSEVLGVPPVRVLEAAGRAGSYVQAHRTLVAR